MAQRNHDGVSGGSGGLSHAPSTMKTMGREASGGAQGCLVMVLGLAFIVAGIWFGVDTKVPEVIGPAIVAGFIFIFIGAYIMNKARHVAWTQEGIERAMQAGAGQEAQQSESCPYCHSRIASDSVFCPDCGQKLRTLCPSCDTAIDHEATFCPKCGHRMKS
jgi:uncharacterized paraquat-inducible protein A